MPAGQVASGGKGEDSTLVMVPNRELVTKENIFAFLKVSPKHFILFLNKLINPIWQQLKDIWSVFKMAWTRMCSTWKKAIFIFKQNGGCSKSGVSRIRSAAWIQPLAASYLVLRLFQYYHQRTAKRAARMVIGLSHTLKIQLSFSYFLFSHFQVMNF